MSTCLACLPVSPVHLSTVLTCLSVFQSHLSPFSCMSDHQPDPESYLEPVFGDGSTASVWRPEAHPAGTASHRHRGVRRRRPGLYHVHHMNLYQIHLYHINLYHIHLIIYI